ncbi:hypothetical protein H0O00_02735, partial [Candidatus Micrarchaeota archaeon]|nr:hypothetical protein [Candidatus Micrarchaeota archaeon]
MAVRTEEARVKVYRNLDEIAKKYHFAPLDEGLNGKPLRKNLMLMTLTHLLDKNCLLVGEPGWGKTTGAKIIVAKLSGLPKDLYDSVEIRGNPQKYEEKLVGRPDYGQLAQGKEAVVWQATFGVDDIIIDEGNRLPYDSQDVILQGVDTGLWIYLNRVLYEGKKPMFMTLNERTGYHQNGLLPALKDRMDIVIEQKYWRTGDAFDFDEAKRRVETELCRHDYTQVALDALAKGYEPYKKALAKRPVNGHITAEEKTAVRQDMLSLELDNDAMLFIQAFMAEINYSEQYGCKRSGDPSSPDTHDKHYAGVSVKNSFSPRSAMAVTDYAKALAWFLQDRVVGLDHVRYVLPHVFAHKAEFTDEYKNTHGGDRRKDNEILHLANTLVTEVAKRYSDTIQPMKNVIARVRKQDLTPEERKAKKLKLSDGTP